MDASTLFAQTAASPEPAILRVRADLERFVAERPRSAEGDIDVARLADETVRRLWESRVTLFVPVLAAREARERLLATKMEERAHPAAPAIHPTSADGAAELLIAMRTWPVLLATGGAALGWPLGALVGRPWLGVGLAGWLGVMFAAWVDARPR